jgi:hypothetical protein
MSFISLEQLPFVGMWYALVGNRLPSRLACRANRKLFSLIDSV